jgi:hypothetical protein
MLQQCASELDSEVTKIGRILDVRWVASSFRAVKATWNACTVLHRHFTQASLDLVNCGSKERAEYAGLSKHIASSSFLQNLALMYDALQEVSDLSEALQSTSISLPKAHRIISRQIDVFRARKESPGECYALAGAAVSQGIYRGVPLLPGKASDIIKPGQFYQALIDSMEARLLPATERPIAAAVGIVLPNQWPDQIGPEYGESELKSLCQTFLFEYTPQLKTAYRDFKDSRGQTVEPVMKQFINAVETLPVSTAECERGFSKMNIICSPLRSSLSVQHIAALMFIGLVGPPLSLWNPLSYVKTWLACGRRDATSVSCATRKSGTAENCSSKISMWQAL